MSGIIFKTKKVDTTFLLLYFAISLILISAAILAYVAENDVFVFIPMGGIVAAILLLQVLSQRYLKIIIKNDQLIIRYFFKVYDTPVKNVTKIRKGETMWSGLHKYGTTTKGLIIFADYANDLYITPQNEALFIETLQNINPEIKLENVI